MPPGVAEKVVTKNRLSTAAGAVVHPVKFPLSNPGFEPGSAPALKGRSGEQESAACRE